MKKATQRTRLLRQLSQVGRDEQRAASFSVCETIMSLPIYQRAEHLALYYAKDMEIQLDWLWQDACKRGKQCYFPKMLPNHALCFLPADLSTRFLKNKVGVLEPEVDVSQQMSTCDLCVVPLIGFDAQGNRLGRGAGYYDRFLAMLHPRYSVGVGYAFQGCDAIEIDATDYPLNLIVTEQGVICPSIG